MKGLIDIDDEEVVMEKKNKRPQKTSEEELRERIYEKQVYLVKLIHSNNYPKMMEFIRDNENTFLKMDDFNKECIRRSCQEILTSTYLSTEEDMKYCDRIFGQYVDIRNSNRVPTGESNIHRESKMTIEEEIAYRSKGSYYAMWDFINNPEWQERLKGRDDLYDKVKYMIDRAKKENIAVSINFKRYEPSDEDMYVKVLELMKK